MTRVSTTPAVRPTMNDVARAAGVSLKTVSRVVNKEPGVRPDTRARVEGAIQALDFRRNEGASQLRSGRTASIGLIVEDVADPFYSALTAAVERVVRRHHHLLLTGSAEGSIEQERALAATFVSHRVAGLLVVPSRPDEAWASGEVTGGTPVVFLDRPAGTAASDTVLADNAGGVRSAVEHLATRGHDHIAFLGDDPMFWTASQRQLGFLTATRDLGLPSDCVAMGPHDPVGVADLLTAWSRLADPVTAVVTGNNQVTGMTLRALRRSGLELSLVGFDDFDLADLVVPSVTVVAQDPAGMGELGARLLFQRLSGAEGPVRTEALPTRLVVRDSSWVRPKP